LDTPESISDSSGPAAPLAAESGLHRSDEGQEIMAEKRSQSPRNDVCRGKIFRLMLDLPQAKLILALAATQKLLLITSALSTTSVVNAELGFAIGSGASVKATTFVGI
jgi:hypothetical protein